MKLDCFFCYLNPLMLCLHVLSMWLIFQTENIFLTCLGKMTVWKCVALTKIGKRMLDHLFIHYLCLFCTCKKKKPQFPHLPKKEPAHKQTTGFHVEELKIELKYPNSLSKRTANNLQRFQIQEETPAASRPQHCWTGTSSVLRNH